MKVVSGCFCQTAPSEIPTPGEGPVIPGALALSLRVIVFF